MKIATSLFVVILAGLSIVEPLLPNSGVLFSALASGMSLLRDNDKKEEEINEKRKEPESVVSSRRSHTHGPGEVDEDHVRLDAEMAQKAKGYAAFVLPAKLLYAQTPQQLSQLGLWSGVKTWPFAFASAATLPDGRILAWGGNNTTYFNGGNNTYAAVWDPVTNEITSINHNDHSMFCAIPTMLEDGRVFVNGGDGTPEKVSIFDFRTNAWTRAENMSTGRWYPGSVALPNRKVFTALGDPGGPYPEIWTQGQGWSLLNGANLNNGIFNFTGFQISWLPYFYLAPSGLIFHLGPTAQMNWIDPAGSGSISSAGLTNTWYPRYGGAVMYDQGKILVAGGQIDGNNQTSTNKAMIVNLNGGVPTKTIITPMAYARKFNNALVLPNGEVMVIGGNTTGTEFSDDGTVLTPEIWNPDTQTWRPVADISVPRNYHSLALLMTDGRVWSGGGGLCGCAADHPDHQVFTPPYLYNPDGTLAQRPSITTAPSIANVGSAVSVTTTTGITKFSLIKMSALTHDLNSDLRYLAVPFTSAGANQYQLTLTSNVNVLTPGYWMLFALNSQGVPSVAKVIQIINNGAPQVTNPSARTNFVGDTVNLAISASDPNNDQLTYSATGLPPELAINSSTGVISGTVMTAGNYSVTVNVSDGTNTSSVVFGWLITQQGSIRYVKLEALSEIYGGPWASAAEVNLLDSGGNVMGRAGWTATADSQETQGENGVASNAIDGSIGTIWHTQWYAATPDYPHWLVIDTKGNYNIGGFRYYPRQTGGTNGTIYNYKFYVSADGVNWGAPAAQGVFEQDFNEKTVTFIPNRPPTISTISNRTNPVGDTVNVTLTASDPDGDPLTWSATGLPTGLSLNAITGLISGSPTTTGTFNVIVTVRDNHGITASSSIVWTITGTSSALAINPVTSAPKPVNTAVSYTASVTNGVNPRFKWLFGDGTPETAYSTSPTMSHVFAQPGIYVVRVTATDDRGVEQSTTFTQAVHLSLTANRPAVSMNIVYEDRATANDRVWVVNQDNDTVSVFDVVTNGKLAEVAVGAAPRSLAVAPNGKVWVTNKRSATISIIDPGSLAVTQTLTLAYGSQPFGIAFAPSGSSAYVALEATGKLCKLDAVTGVVVSTATVGANVRHLSISGDGAKVYVSRFITPPAPGEGTAAPQVANAGGVIVHVNAGAMTVAQTIQLRHSDNPDTENSGRGIPNYLGPAVISPDGIWAWTPSKQDNILRGSLRDGRNLTFDSTVRSITSRINLVSGTEDTGARIDHNNAGIVDTAVFDHYGNYLFVAAEGSREVIVVDAHGKRELFRIDVGRAPEGLALSADGSKLYVNNFMDRTVTVLEVGKVINEGASAAQTLATLNAVATERLTTQVLLGKQLFYDARDTRLTADAYISCASCHNDGGHDGRVWDFTGLGEGLRNTIALNGRAGAQGFKHWSGNFDEIHDFEGQIRNLSIGTGLMTDAQFNTGTRSQPLGDPKAGVSSDLDALVAYVFSLNAFAQSPYRATGGALTADAAEGKTIFQTMNCAQCHSGTTFTNSGAANLIDIGTIKPSSGSRLGGALTGIDTPTLRDVWMTAPYLHDGSAATLEDAVRAHNGVTIADASLTKLATYLLQIGSEEPTAPANNQSPAVSITSPANNATFTAPASVTINASASDADGTITRVEFYQGAALLGTDTTAPYSFAWSNVVAGNYSLTARAFDNAGAVTTSTAIAISVNGSTNGTGLTGQYYDNMNLTNLKLTRTDPTVNFDWGSGSPSTLIGANTFSVRWSGQVQAQYSETYTLYTTSTDGVRLWVNGQLLVNNWTNHSATENSGTIALQANQKYNILMEYYDNTGAAVAKLFWSSASQSKQAIPQARLYPTAENNPLVYVSDLTPTFTTNGWGPYEPDRSNGEEGATDGRTIMLSGVTYTKGLGVHSVSELRYALNGQYASFLADVGMDDEVGDAGTVVFQVWADGVKLYDSGLMYGFTATKAVFVNVAGKNELRLIVTDGGDQVHTDHGDWANARLVR